MPPWTSVRLPKMLTSSLASLKTAADEVSLGSRPPPGTVHDPFDLRLDTSITWDREGGKERGRQERREGEGDKSNKPACHKHWSVHSLYVGILSKIFGRDLVPHHPGGHLHQWPITCSKAKCTHLPPGESPCKGLFLAIEGLFSHHA